MNTLGYRWMQIVACIGFLLCSSSATLRKNYYHQNYRQHRQVQPHFLQFQTQRYIAIPGNVVDQYNPVTPFAVQPVPAVQRYSHPPIRPSLRVPLFPSRFRSDFDSEMSSTPPEDSEEEMDINQQVNPQPGFEPEPQPQPQPQPDPGQGNDPQTPPNEPPPSQEEGASPLPMPSPSSEDSDDHHPHHHHPKVIHKHISIHVPPEEMEEEEVTVIRPKLPGPDKQVNIVFIKAPAPKEKKFDVVLPEKPKEKTLIYILVKKSNPETNIRVLGPPQTQPSKPKVYFIKYKYNNKWENESPSRNGYALRHKRAVKN